MIISASRRTDIPAWYSDWFLNRIKAGYVLVRNPMNRHQVSRVCLSPEVVDGIVFWTKNPLPMLGKLSALQDYPFYFQFTVTAYGLDIEPGIPAKTGTILPAFRRLADEIGPDRMVWRYDPIAVSQDYFVAWHIDRFAELAGQLHDYTQRCTISFIDIYRKTAKQMRELNFLPVSAAEQRLLGSEFSAIAKRYGLMLSACAEEADLRRFGITPARCVDTGLLEKLTGSHLRVDKDKNQRPACGCAASVDIGMYDTCRSGCRYCYATHAANGAQSAHARHDPESPLLCGEIGADDIILDRPAISCKCSQLSLFG